METHAAWLVVVGTGVFTMWFCLQIITRRVAPPLATWIIFAVGATCALASSLAHNPTWRDIAKNTTNKVDAATLWVVVFVIWWRVRKDGKKHFDLFDKKCFGVAGVMFAIWLLSQAATTPGIASAINIFANAFFNLFMEVGYGPTLKRMKKRRANTESFTVWGISLAVNIVGVYVQVHSHDTFGFAYALRGTLSIIAVLIIMTYWELRSRHRPR